jgi:hypothetical protein
MPAAARAEIVKQLETAISIGVCPAMVGLVGDGSGQGLSGVWPLMLPLAPYTDAVVA